MRQQLRRVAIAALCGASTAAMHGQAVNAGDIRGTVTDATGALVPGVTVTVTNVETGVAKTLTTNKDGLYDTSSIVVGTYSLRFEKQGFQSFERNGVTLVVGFSTVNAVMKIGAASETVEVNSDIPLLKTETGEQSTTFESKDMAQLPNAGGANGPDWQNFTILLPGTSGVPGGSQGATNPGQEVAVNGNLPYSNVLADGATTTLSHSQNSDVSIFETVAELQINTSAFSAQYGIGGAIFNQISKSGTNQFHGSAYDYFQNNALNAAQYGFASHPTVPVLHYNNFGGSIGGPVIIPHLFNGKDKLFFFFNYDQIVNHGAGSNSTQTVPTEQVKTGDFTGQSLLYDPTTQVIAHDGLGNPYPIRKSFLSEYGVNAVPAALFDKVSANFQKLYPTPTSHLASGKFVPGQLNGAGLLTNNWYSSVPQSTPVRRYFGRLDYNLRAADRISMSVTQRDTPVTYPNSVAPCPIGCQFGDVDSNNAQITEVHTFSGGKLINEARMGFTYQGNFYADQTLGQGLPAQLGWQFGKADSLPAVQFNGSYPYAWINPSSNAVYKEQVFDPSDVVTMIRGKHILHFGGEFLMYDDNSTAWGNTNAGTLQFNGSYTRQWALTTNSKGQQVAGPVSGTGLDYADFLLGDADGWSASVSPEYGARLKSPQVFIQDDYKVRPNLTINVGLRYQVRHGWNETHGNMATWDQTITNPVGNTAGGFWYGTTHTNGRTSLQADEYKTFLPRVGFSWLPFPTTTLRGGFGLYAYNLSLDTYGAGMGQAITSSGSYSDNTSGITPVTQFGGAGTNLQTGQALPYTAASTNPDRFNGQNVNFNQYHTPTPQIFQYNLAMQNTLGTNMVFELAYVGSHGKNLNYGGVNLNAIAPSNFSSNDYGTRPFTNYQDITGSSNDAISNYNSLQASIQRRLSKGISFDANYTWAHFLDSWDSSGWGSRNGPTQYQLANSAASNYSNSNFDVRNAFKARVVYDLPFGRGRMFMNKNIFADEVFGGWQVSSTMIFQGGNPFTVYSQQANYQHAGSMFPNYNGGPLYASNKSYNNWINPASFTLPANGAFGNFRRNSVYGPGVELVNLSAGKHFDLYENLKLQIRADATNAFNHANFEVGNSVTLQTRPQVVDKNGNITDPGQQPGQAYISTAAGTPQFNGLSSGGRVLQLSARFEF